MVNGMEWREKSKGGTLQKRSGWEEKKLGKVSWAAKFAKWRWAKAAGK